MQTLTGCLTVPVPDNNALKKCSQVTAVKLYVRGVPAAGRFHVGGCRFLLRTDGMSTTVCKIFRKTYSGYNTIYNKPAKSGWKH